MMRVPRRSRGLKNHLHRVSAWGSHRNLPGFFPFTTEAYFDYKSTIEEHTGTTAEPDYSERKAFQCLNLVL